MVATSDAVDRWGVLSPPVAPHRGAGYDCMWSSGGARRDAGTSPGAGHLPQLRASGLRCERLTAAAEQEGVRPVEGAESAAAAAGEGSGEEAPSARALVSNPTHATRRSVVPRISRCPSPQGV